MDTNKPKGAAEALDVRNSSAETKELRDRMTHFYGQTDGSFRFPNSCEGDLLRMTARMLGLLPNSPVDPPRPGLRCPGIFVAAVATPGRSCPLVAGCVH